MQKIYCPSSRFSTFAKFFNNFNDFPNTESLMKSVKLP